MGSDLQTNAKVKSRTDHYVTFEKKTPYAQVLVALPQHLARFRVAQIHPVTEQIQEMGGVRIFFPLTVEAYSLNPFCILALLSVSAAA